jgi:hypothetical protein
MMTMQELTYKLSDFKEDPIIMMEISSYKKEWVSTMVITDNNNSDKHWIGIVDKKMGKFSVNRYIKGLFGKRASIVKITGIKSELSNQIQIRFKPSILFGINFFGVPIFLYFLLTKLTFGLYEPLIIGLVVLFNSLHFYLEFKKSKTQMKEFMDSLK